MLQVLFTLDYEIHGNGEGSSYDLMVEPTARMLDLFDRYGAKLTIMADVAEILRFRDYLHEYGRDDYHYEAIVSQLREAIQRGHDVQLHLHCSYFNASFAQGRWHQDWSEYSFAHLPLPRMTQLVAIGKQFLEETLHPVDRSYRCRAFRAANWAVQPSRNVIQALLENNIEIDTSVFKYGKREGLVSFDYTSAVSNIRPWRVSPGEICKEDHLGVLVEVPIYCELRSIFSFATVSRLKRARMTNKHRVQWPERDFTSVRNHHPLKRLLRTAFCRHAWKADFNQCTSKQLVSAISRAERSQREAPVRSPFVLIGHSKQFDRSNENDLAELLRWIRDGKLHGFATFKDLELPPRHSPNSAVANQQRLNSQSVQP